MDISKAVDDLLSVMAQERRIRAELKSGGWDETIRDYLHVSTWHSTILSATRAFAIQDYYMKEF